MHVARGPQRKKRPRDQQCGEARTAAVGSYRLSQASRRFKIGGSEDIQMSGFRSALQPAGEVVKVSCGSI